MRTLTTAFLLFVSLYALASVLFVTVETGIAPPPSSIDAQISASRTSGSLPLYVYFDASGTTDPDTPRPFHQLTYCFDADSTNVATKKPDYTSSGKTTDAERWCGGPGFAYVFEEPVTYVVEVTVYAADGDISTATIEVTPSDYLDGQTTCVDETNGAFDDDGDPRCSAFDVRKVACPIPCDFNAQISSAISAGDRRILFHEDDSFTTDDQNFLSTPDIHIGAYGTGGDGRFTVDGSISDLFAIEQSDIRITNLAWNPASSGSDFIDGIQMDPARDNILIQNLDLSNLGTVIWANQFLAAGDIPRGVGVFNVQVTDGCVDPDGYCFYVSIDQLAIVDSTIDFGPGSGSRQARLFQTERTWIHNTLWTDATTAKDRGFLTLRSTPKGGGLVGGYWAEAGKAIISDSHFAQDSVQSVEICADNGDGDNVVECQDIIMERNLFTCDSSVGSSGMIWVNTGRGAGSWTRNLTLRDNIFLYTGCSASNVAIKRDDTQLPNPDNSLIYNNSAYGLGASTFAQVASNWDFRNNLSWGVTTMTAGTPNLETNNASESGTEPGHLNLTVCPYEVCPPTTTAQFDLNTGGADYLLLRDGGAPWSLLFSYNDFDNNVRNNPPSIGAKQ